MNKVSIKRAYEPSAASDGYRALVDRLWPRGVSKERAALSEWAKEIAPSKQIREAVHSALIDWDEFGARYKGELLANPLYHDWEAKILEILKEKPVTLVTAAKAIDKNHAFVLKELLEGQRQK